ncbi:MAG TPA: glycosyltransferase [Patescibacteria group bacterium]|nr:glycosyltransferase [Patescibacteria group bacterium]
MKIAVITCYDQNDYVRARTLRRAFAACEGVEVVVIKNQHKGLVRYIEVPLKILHARLTGEFDAYVLTFRGYEMLLFMRLTWVRKPVIFDELVNFIEYYEEHEKIRKSTWVYGLLRRLYTWQVRGCALILADTLAHAKYSASVVGLPLSTFRVLPISADENIFSPKLVKRPKEDIFTVFYYGNGMTPLQGLEHVLEAAVLLKDIASIQFQIVGGDKRAASACNEAQRQGAHITYEAWVPFEKMADRFRTSGICLGGPFGKTLQSRFVVTGKTTQIMACALPVIVAENKASGIFKDKVNCLLIPQADPKALASAVRWAQSHQKQLQAIGQAGRRLYEQHFSQRVSNQVVESIVQDLSHD